MSPEKKRLGYFITGTDTGVGKTLIASSLVYKFAQSGYKAAGMKPVAAGCQLVNEKMLSEDVTQLIAASNVNAAPEHINPYAFASAIAPHIAAQQAGVEIDLGVIKQAYVALTEVADVVIVEGVGGFCVPLNDGLNTADLVQALNLPIILVVGMRLGCINHALLTLQAIEARGLQLAGWIANTIDSDVQMLDENLLSLKQRIKVPCLGVVPWQPAAGFAITADYLRNELLVLKQ